MPINMPRTARLDQVINSSKSRELLESYGDAVIKTCSKKNRFLIALNEIIFNKIFKERRSYRLKT